MLTEKFFINCSDDIVGIYNDFTDSVIERMAYEIKALGKLDNIEKQAKLVLSANGIYDDMVAKLAKLTNRSQKEIKKVLQNAGVETLKYDDEIYKRAGFNPAPINQSPLLLQIMSGIGASTNQNLYNLVKTSANATSNLFFDTLNTSLMEVATGARDYNSSIGNAIKKLATYGTIITYPSGAKAQLDTMVRRAVLTGVSDVANEIQMQRANEFGALYADTSAHAGARPTHSEWQGKRFRLSDNAGVNMKYPHFLTEPFGKENKPVYEQLQDPNCRHSWYPVMFDEEPIAYNSEYINELNNQKVYYNGKEFTTFEAEQRLRQIERNIRKYKRQANALEINGLDNSFEINKVRQWQKEARSFVKQTGIQRRYINEKIYY